eukprot:scpid41346/ scgid35090/ 
MHDTQTFRRTHQRTDTVASEHTNVQHHHRHVDSRSKVCEHTHRITTDTCTHAPMRVNTRPASLQTDRDISKILLQLLLPVLTLFDILRDFYGYKQQDKYCSCVDGEEE